MIKILTLFSVLLLAPCAFASSTAVLLSPLTGTTFTSSSQAFTWTTGNATSIEIAIGTAPGLEDVSTVFATSAQLASGTLTLTGLPTDGSIMYITFYSAADGSWTANKGTYHAMGANT